jgi:PIN domain nuclease of toxin-antitoxin system
MKLLLDTHVFLWWNEASLKLSRIIAIRLTAC